MEHLFHTLKFHSYYPRNGLPLSLNMTTLKHQFQIFSACWNIQMYVITAKSIHPKPNSSSSLQGRFIFVFPLPLTLPYWNISTVFLLFNLIWHMSFWSLSQIYLIRLYFWGIQYSLHMPPILSPESIVVIFTAGEMFPL